jgi:hypothetical protein
MSQTPTGAGGFMTPDSFLDETDAFLDEKVESL